MSKYVDDDDDVEVLYERPYANGSDKNNKIRRNGSNVNGGVINKRVDFENVFDPFERDQDDVREFFDDSSDKNDDSHDDWEKPTMFNDPRKVCNENCDKISPIDSILADSTSDF